MKVLEYRGLGGFSIVHINTSFVVVNVRRGVNVILPNLHADDRAAFSRMLVEHAQSKAKRYATVAAARRVADDARLRIIEHLSRDTLRRAGVLRSQRR